MAESIGKIRAAAAAGVNPNAARPDESHSALHWAVFAGRPGVVKALINAGATPNGESWCEGDTSLHVASAQNDVNSLRMLLDCPSDKVINHFDADLTWTPLIVAAKKDHLVAARMLLDAGADPNVDVGPMRIRDTPIAHAAMDASVEMVQLLLDFGADPTLPGWMQLTAIHRAQQRGGTEGKQMLTLMQQHARISNEDWPQYLLRI